MTDDLILREFEAGAIPAEQWTHAMHVLVACACLRRDPLEEALDRMRKGIHRINEVHGTPESLDRGYHETITVAWMTLVEATMRRDGKGQDATSFLETHPELTDRLVLQKFYSRDRIMSWEAKRGFLEPDLGSIEPLPREGA